MHILEYTCNGFLHIFSKMNSKTVVSFLEKKNNMTNYSTDNYLKESKGKCAGCPEGLHAGINGEIYHCEKCQRSWICHVDEKCLISIGFENRRRLGVCLECKSKRENAEIKLGIEKMKKENEEMKNDIRELKNLVLKLTNK